MKTEIRGIIGKKKVTFPDTDTGEIRERIILKTAAGDVWTSEAPDQGETACAVNIYAKGEAVPWAEGEKFNTEFVQFDYYTSAASIKAAKSIQEEAADLLEMLS